MERLNRKEGNRSGPSYTVESFEQSRGPIGRFLAKLKGESGEVASVYKSGLKSEEEAKEAEQELEKGIKSIVGYDIDGINTRIVEEGSS